MDIIEGSRERERERERKWKLFSVMPLLSNVCERESVCVCFRKREEREERKTAAAAAAAAPAASLLAITAQLAVARRKAYTLRRRAPTEADAGLL